MALSRWRALIRQATLLTLRGGLGCCHNAVCMHLLHAAIAVWALCPQSKSNCSRSVCTALCTLKSLIIVIVCMASAKQSASQTDKTQVKHFDPSSRQLLGAL